MRQFSSKVLTKIAIGILIIFIGIGALGLRAFAEDKPVETPISDIEDIQESSPTPEPTPETTPEPSDDMDNIDGNVNNDEENSENSDEIIDESVNAKDNAEDEQDTNENEIARAETNTSVITLDTNGGTLDNKTTVEATTGSTYGMISGEQTFDQSSDGCTLGYANYDFGSTLTASIKLKFTNYDIDYFEFFDNFEWGGFGFGRAKKSWANSKEIFYFEVFVNNQYVMAYINDDLKPGEIYWITGVYDGNNSRLELYVNGEKRTDARIVNSNSGSEIQNVSGPIKKSSMPVTLNANPDIDSDGTSFGMLTNLTTYKAGVWTTAMSQEQITDMVSNDYINSNALINVDYTPRRPGCTFDGWYEDLNDPNSKITATTKITKNTTLHAKWKGLSTITIDPNGGTYKGSNSKTSETVASGTIYELNEIPTRPGYTFQGWKLSGGGTKKWTEH